jgi:hypothetical protein
MRSPALPLSRAVRTSAVVADCSRRTAICDARAPLAMRMIQASPPPLT